jgi:hypothetical protein
MVKLELDADESCDEGSGTALRPRLFLLSFI